MGDSVQQTSRSFYRVVSLQAFIVMVVVIATATLADAHRAKSAVIGGVIAVLGSLFYAMIVAGASGDASRIMRTHFRAEMVKIFVTVVLFILAILLFQSASMLWLILGFAIATLSYWLALLVF